MSAQALYDLFDGLEEDQLIASGSVFGFSDETTLDWKVLEVHEENDTKRVTLELYYLGVKWKRVIVTMNKGTLLWESKL